MKNIVGLFGTESSGKTVFLAVLFHELKTGKIKELTLNILKDNESEKYLNFIAEDLYQNKILPSKTDERYAQKIVIDLGQQDEKKDVVISKFRLETYDLSGEALFELLTNENLKDNNNKNQDLNINDKNIPIQGQSNVFINLKKAIDSLINQSSSFMFMVDPNPMIRFKQDRFFTAILRQIIITNQKKKWLKSNSVIKNVSIAFVLSKSDLYPQNRHTERELQRLIPQSWNLAKQLYFNRNRIKEFYISSLGYNINYNILEDGTKFPIVPENIEPVNVIEPLIWFKEQFKTYKK